MKQLKTKIEGANILSENEVKGLLSAPFDELRQLFANHYPAVAYGSAPHAFFKRISDTTTLIQKVAIEYQNKSGDQAVIALQGQLDAGDPYNQKLSNYLADQAEQI